jgi:putative ATPase
MSDLFAAAAEERLARRAPLAARMRPTSLDDIVGQQHLLAPGRPLRTLIETDRLSSVIIWGPPGTGKTTLAQLIARTTAKAFEQLSAVTATVKDVREVIASAQARLGQHEQGTILFLDEVHRFNKAQQDALLPSVESGLLVLIGATTENPYFEVNPPLLSRSTMFRLEPLDDASITELLRRGLRFEDATADDDALSHLAGRAAGDGRHALTLLEVAIALAWARDRAASHVTLADAEAAASAKALRHGDDAHYDIASAFIKSIRGSDVDAGLYWLARMLEAGEDARFIARRLVILASEDVGMADPTGLLVADAAARAVEFVGLPEAQLNLAHAVVYLALAPKSNGVIAALGLARADAQRGGVGAVPMHLRDAHYRGARSLGHGVGYVYPHDDPDGAVGQEYRPAEVAGNTYWDRTEDDRERS